MTAWPAAFRAVLDLAVGAGAKHSAPRASARTTAAARMIFLTDAVPLAEMRCKSAFSSA